MTPGVFGPISTSAVFPVARGNDNRTGLTSADGAATTLYAATTGLYRVTADIFATAAVTGTATYTVAWTENSGTRTIAVTSTAVNINGTVSALIRPDSGTNITAQLTGVFTGTFSVAAIVEQLV